MWQWMRSARLRNWLTARRTTEELEPGRADLVVVAEAFNPSESCSGVLARASSTHPVWRATDAAVLRHHLAFRGNAQQAAQIAAIDGYSVAVAAPYLSPSRPAPEDGDELIVLQRVQKLSALSCAQEASRMASLASRLGGQCYGWDALQPLHE
ncbi:hypothetical protein [Hoyosella subflava]|uniref:Uncharacterized protein n=1 Tax=Hoyosella subflava (strain DSM 45089 / JCM 17490 / NBRC 109087 / DQS3-9A1) TaxID=443218 RepID=F6EFC1_HOYSD|nr:hypothetical protein [Hoyosella subflava]AEF39734.1 hypothetical protein AS9A_1282 [Hoyosella subflava DQS3-9A1]